MNAKHYVSLEAAKKLEELGYDESIGTTIDEDGVVFYEEYSYSWSEEKSVINCVLPVGYYKCPTLLEAMDWLESKGIKLYIPFGRDWKHEEWWFYIIAYKAQWIEDGRFKDRNECMQKAIEKALELL